MRDSIAIVAAGTVAPDDLREALITAFADYLLGPLEVSRDEWPGFLARQGVDLRISRVAMGPSTPLAFALVAPRPRHGRWRLATMGAIPTARGNGVAAQLLDELIGRATVEGALGLELEVFDANEQALGLYRSRGFQPVHALHGYEFAAGSTSATVVVTQIHESDRNRAFAWLDATEERIPDLPLQVTRGSLSSVPQALHAWERGSAQLVFSEGADGVVLVHSLIDRDPSQTDAQALAEALACLHAGRRIRVPQLQRRDVGSHALIRSGFAELQQCQWLMLRTLK